MEHVQHFALTFINAAMDNIEYIVIEGVVASNVRIGRQFLDEFWVRKPMVYSLAPLYTVHSFHKHVQYPQINFRSKLPNGEIFVFIAQHQQQQPELLATRANMSMPQDSLNAVVVLVSCQNALDGIMQLRNAILYGHPVEIY